MKLQLRPALSLTQQSAQMLEKLLRPFAQRQFLHGTDAITRLINDIGDSPGEVIRYALLTQCSSGKLAAQRGVNLQTKRLLKEQGCCIPHYTVEDDHSLYLRHKGIYIFEQRDEPVFLRLEDELSTMIRAKSITAVHKPGK